MNTTELVGAADLDDPAERAMLADALEEAGYKDGRKIALLRASLVSLHLWVENQPDWRTDETHGYVLGCRSVLNLGPHEGRLFGKMTDGDGRTLACWNGDACVLAGRPDEVCNVYVMLREDVALLSHNPFGDDPADLGTPSLTACPASLREEGWTSATETVARMASREARTWGDFLRRML